MKGELAEVKIVDTGHEKKAAGTYLSPGTWPSGLAKPLRVIISV